MSSIVENILPESADLIRHARSLPGIPIETRLTPYQSIGALLSARATEHPDKMWLIYCDDNGWAAEYTYSQFEILARKAASLLNEQGLSPGDRVATMMPNDARTVILYFAAWLLGATVVPVNCGEDDDRVRFVIENSEAKCVVAHTEHIGRCLGFRESLPSVTAWIEVGGAKRDGFCDFDSGIESQDLFESPLSDQLDSECLIVYTSGTTGAPKGVVLEQYNLLADARSIAEWHRFRPDDRAMCILPIHHVNGTIVTLMTPLYSGGSVILNSRFRAQSFWKTLAEAGCTWVSVVPTILAFLCERGEDLSRYDLSRFRHIICGAGPLTVELTRRFDEIFGKRVVHGYGLSETTCYSCFLPIELDEATQRHWMTECGFPSIGCPISVNEMAIHDAEGNALAEDTRGEIVIRGHNVMKHYFKRPGANRDTFAHGWFRSGDEGFYREGEDGRNYFFITGRLKELIIRGGVNYSPFDIDEVLNAIPGVKAAMAVGFENHFYGEEVGAYVKLEDDAELTESEIIVACRKELAFSKCPKVVVFGDEFPVTSTGKYQRNRLKPLFEEWKNTQFRESKA